MKKNLLVLPLLFIAAFSAVAQEASEDTTGAAVGIVIHADPRLDALLTKQASVAANIGAATGTTPRPRRGGIHSSRGYRLVIYSGNDRAKAMKAKIEFAQRFPRTRTYLTYSAPQFKVKAGDFPTRGDAARMQSMAGAYFSPVMIVPDIIVVNTLRNDY